ncbi:MAG: TIGR01777 family oxidoreductase [Chloroflexota bacterium]|nr:TIGR01777 family oxidoreductase [Dehalococcoidia bacterium]MDW8252915.1 TIGR01777 family oxidoreductase [Chloroflexota bacterium]
MKVAITGASGFIGRKLAAVLRDAGHVPLAISHNVERAASALPGAEVISFNQAIADWPAVDAVVNLMGEPVTGRWTAEKKREIHDSRVIGTRKLVEAIERAGQRPRRFVSASAVGYYGDRGDEELIEDSPPGRSFLAEVCQRWEAEAKQVGPLGVSWAIVRIGLVLGEGGGALAPLTTLFKLGLGGPIGSGRQWMPWVSLEDTARLIHFLVESDHEGVFLATAPEPVRQAEFASALGKVLGRPAVLPAPAFAIRLVVGEFAAELLDSRRCLPARTTAVGFRFEYPRLVPALRAALRAAVEAK